MNLPVVYLQHCHQLPFAGDRDVEWKTHAPGGPWEVTVIRGVPVRWIVIEVMFPERNIAIKLSQCRAYIIHVDRRHKHCVQIPQWILKLHWFCPICSLIILQYVANNCFLTWSVSREVEAESTREVLSWSRYPKTIFQMGWNMSKVLVSTCRCCDVHHIWSSILISFQCDRQICWMTWHMTTNSNSSWSFSLSAALNGWTLFGSWVMVHFGWGFSQQACLVWTI